jgi:hypothetical protein
MEHFLRFQPRGKCFMSTILFNHHKNSEMRKLSPRQFKGRFNLLITGISKVSRLESDLEGACYPLLGPVKSKIYFTLKDHTQES